MKSFIEELRKRAAEGMSQSDAIDAMQRSELSIIEAIKLSRELFGTSLAAAKLTVTSHPAYSKDAEAAAPLHDELLRAFEELAETPPGEE